MLNPALYEAQKSRVTIVMHDPDEEADLDTVVDMISRQLQERGLDIKVAVFHTKIGSVVIMYSGIRPSIKAVEAAMEAEGIR